MFFLALKEFVSNDVNALLPSFENGRVNLSLLIAKIVIFGAINPLRQWLRPHKVNLSEIPTRQSLVLLIMPGILYKYNQIHVGNDEPRQQHVRIQIGMTCQIVNDYVGFYTDEVIAEGSKFTEAKKSLCQMTAMRIAMLLQGENYGKPR